MEKKTYTRPKTDIVKPQYTLMGSDKPGGKPTDPFGGGVSNPSTPEDQESGWVGGKEFDTDESAWEDSWVNQPNTWDSW